MKLLVIEDSERLRKSLEVGFTRLGYRVTVTPDGQEGLNLALENDYDLIVLDLMLPSLDGLSLLREMRDRKNSTAVLILSAKDQVEDRLKGFDIGADDYLCKPFAFDELHARVKSLIRRSHQLESSDIVIGNVCINLASRQVFVDENLVNLTPNEYTILEHLAANIGRVITYANLENYLYDNYATVTRNAIEAHVSAIRKKLKLASGEPLIKTRRGFGYVIEKE